jgi:integrase
MPNGPSFLENRVWKIPSPLTKTNTTRVIPLNDVAMEVIAELDTKDKYPFLFINPRTENLMPTSTRPGSVFALMPASNPADCMIYAISFGHTLASSGESLWIISKLLGHTQSKTSESVLGGEYSNAGGCVEYCRKGHSGGNEKISVITRFRCNGLPSAGRERAG